MVRSAESVVIRRTPEDVFAYVADLRNEPNWHVDIDSVDAATDPVPSVGRTYPLRFKPFMGKTDGQFTALDVTPGEQLVYRGDFAGLQPLITYKVEPAPEGAKFTRSVDMRPRGLGMLMAPAMAFMVPRRNKVFVQNLKAVLER